MPARVRGSPVSFCKRERVSGGRLPEAPVEGCIITRNRVIDSDAIAGSAITYYSDHQEKPSFIVSIHGKVVE